MNTKEFQKFEEAIKGVQALNEAFLRLADSIIAATSALERFAEISSSLIKVEESEESSSIEIPIDLKTFLSEFGDELDAVVKELKEGKPIVRNPKIIEIDLSDK